MLVQLIIPALVLGSVSSFHCVGMCGPIAISLPVYYLPRQQKIPGILLYNIGRIAMYALLGLLIGFAGRQIYLGGFQQGFSIVLGSLVILFFLQSLLPAVKIRIVQIDRFTQSLQRFIAHRMKQPGLPAMFTLGAANGLLPCGMVYLALTGALAAGTITGGVAFMLFFGLGTLPAMFAIGYFGNMISLSARKLMRKTVPFFMLIMGILLIVRGLNLNIPYLSPYLFAGSEQAVSCH